jgi:hypothetical protein
MISRSLRALALGAALLAVSAAPQAVPAFAQDAPPECTAPAAAGGAQDVNGVGSRNSAPFRLDGGAYRVNWSLSSEFPTVISFSLRSADETTNRGQATIASGPITPGPRVDVTYLYNVAPGTYYIDALAPAGWDVTLTPITLCAAQDAPSSSDPAVAAVAPARSVADFAGGWGRHGLGMTIKPDGSGDASWRVYQWCKDTGGKQPCDGMNSQSIVPGGMAALLFDHVEGATLVGTVSGSTDPATLPNGPIRLTERDYGIGEVVKAVPSAPGDPPMTLCGPRFASAPEWFRRTSPCGA